MITVIEKLRTYLCENFEFINPLICDIDNPSVFDESLVSEADYAIILSPGWSEVEGDQAHGFDSSLFNWEIIMNFHRILYGAKDEQAVQIKDAYQKIEEIHAAIVHDPTLGDSVSVANVQTIAPPMSYSRTDRDDWVLVPVSIKIKEVI